MRNCCSYCRNLDYIFLSIFCCFSNSFRNFQSLAEANANAKTTDDLRILNMVKMGGGYEKVAASIKSNYTPEKREPVTSKAEEVTQRNYLKERIEAAKNKTNK